MLSTTDRLIGEFDHCLRTLSGVHRGTGRPSPAQGLEDKTVRPWERRKAGRMIRVDHAGEVMAQALYTGQRFGAADPSLETHLEQAAAEEEDHLLWCEGRLGELRTRPSLLNPLWYLAGWGMGYLAARAGKGTNLGLVVAVERQVEAHLSEHLAELPADDTRSRAIVAQMKADETGHADKAQTMGATPLPLPAMGAMGILSKLLTRGALWI